MKRRDTHTRTGDNKPLNQRISSVAWTHTRCRQHNTHTPSEQLWWDAIDEDTNTELSQVYTSRCDDALIARTEPARWFDKPNIYILHHKRLDYTTFNRIIHLDAHKQTHLHHTHTVATGRRVYTVRALRCCVCVCVFTRASVNVHQVQHTKSRTTFISCTRIAV